MKIKVTYSEDERKLFEHIRAELLRNIPNVRQHTSTAPADVHVWYLSTCKKVHKVVK